MSEHERQADDGVVEHSSGTQPGVAPPATHGQRRTPVGAARMLLRDVASDPIIGVYVGAMALLAVVVIFAAVHLA